jgi:hypothetical protein avisC_02045
MMKQRDKQRISMALSTAQLASPLIGMPAFAPLVELTKQAFASLPEDSTTRTETHYDLIKNIKNKIPQWVSEQKDAFQINGIDASQLEVIKAEALAYVDKLEHEYQPLSRAIQDPVETQKAWKQRSTKQAENMDAKLATYFDNIVDKILLEYTLSACQSVYWQLEISTKLSNDKTDLKNELNKALEKFAQQINETIISHSPDYKDSKKILHTPRPRQAHNYIQRNIDQILNECLFTAQRKRTALIGMTGTGKTQLATALATECENRKWSLVAWMDGSSKSAITSGLVELARAMEVDTKDEPTEKEIITRLFTKLKSSDWDDRLIIFDNVDDITDLTDLTPDAPGLRVIATTTNSIGWGQQSWQSINVENFRRIDAIRYLLSTTQSYDKATADLIAAKLGDLPLALAQAAATALNEKWSLEQYLFRLEKFSSDDVIHSSPGDPYKNEVSFALLLAKESATNKLKSDVRKEADKIIYVLTLLAASGIPTQWLDPFHNNSEISTTSDENAMNKHHALNALIHNSIIQQSKDTNITTIHRFQAQVMREYWDAEERDAAVEAAARLLGDTISKTLNSLPTTSRQHEALALIQQIEAISNQEHSQAIFQDATIQDTLKEIFQVVDKLGIAYAATRLDKAVNLTSRYFGNTSRSTILCQIGLGDAFANSGDTTTALKILKDTCLRSKDNLGEDDPATLSGNLALAEVYAKKEHYKKACKLAEDTYSGYVRVFDENHPHTLKARNSLAKIHLQVGNATQAIDHCLGLVDSLIHINCQDSDFILTVLNNLAAAFQQDDQASEAIELFERICDQPISVHKNGYHDYYICKYNLATAYRSDNQPTRAISLLEEICEESEQLIGRYNEYRFTFRTRLANWYLEDRNFTKAVEIISALHEDSGRAFGKDSKKTLEYEHMLAFAYAEQGDFHSALPFIEHAYNSRLSTLGASDTATLQSKYNLAFTLLKLNDPDGAIPLMVEALNDDHMNSDEMTDMQLNLAYAYHMQNDFTAALKTYLLARKTCQQDPDAYAEKLNFVNQQISSLRAFLRQPDKNSCS